MYMYDGFYAHTKTFTSGRKMMRTQRGVLYQIKVILIWTISRGTFTSTCYLFILTYFLSAYITCTIELFNPRLNKKNSHIVTES